MSRPGRPHDRRIAAVVLAALSFFLTAAAPLEETAKYPTSPPLPAEAVFGSGAGSGASVFRSGQSASEDQNPGKRSRMLDSRDVVRTVQTVALFGLVSLAPVGVLMLTAFVRINIVLALLRQALGSPQVPGNQVLMALALLLTALVMRPVGERVYNQAILPYQSGQASEAQAWAAGSEPIKLWMVNQIIKAKHQDYLWSLYRYAAPPSHDQAEPEYGHEFPFRVVAPAYLLERIDHGAGDGLLPLLALPGDRSGGLGGAGRDGSLYASAHTGVDAHQAHRIRHGRRLDARVAHASLELRGRWALAGRRGQSWNRPM